MKVDKGSGAVLTAIIFFSGWSSRSADRSQGRDEIQAPGGLDLPSGIPEGLAALDGTPECLLFRRIQRRIDAPGPVGRPLGRPGAQRRPLRRPPGGTPPEAPPPP